MIFRTIGSTYYIEESMNPVAYLIRDNWNDWHEFRTMYSLVIAQGGNRIDVGSVKIGQFGQTNDRPNIPDTFEHLPDTFFSIGQDEDYYLTLNEDAEDFRAEILEGLRDMAFSLDTLERFRDERVALRSLFRSVSIETVRSRYHRIATGNAELTAFSFNYRPPTLDGATSPLLRFRVQPESRPPTNIHVLIGSNGAGKTRILNHLTHALVNENPDEADWGQFTNTAADSSTPFSAVIFVSFSAFDEFAPPSSVAEHIKFEYVGLQQHEPEVLSPEPQEHRMTWAKLTHDFVVSASRCSRGRKRVRWLESLKLLESDALFSDAAVSSLVEDAWNSEAASTTFQSLSSGHKIVLLAITRLVEQVDERSLVLIDEPEGHLHPPLLAAFVRALSNLLTQRNGVALLATHSPVVLQEVPKSCVWIMNRAGTSTTASRPDLETFGENVGVLTREAFGLEVLHSGFNRLLRECADQAGSYDDALQAFQGQLGAEGRALLRLYCSRAEEEE